MKLILSIFLLTTLTTISSSLSIDTSLQCEFKRDTWGIVNDIYVCIVENVESMDKFDKIRSVSGDHLNDLTNDHVKGVLFRGDEMKNFPKGLAEIFPNLKVIAIEKTGLSEIKSEDLKDFKKLQYLFLFGNEIKNLESGVFDGNPRLSHVVLSENGVKRIYPNVFTNLQELEYINLISNQCREIASDEASTPQEMKKLVNSIERGGCLDDADEYEIFKKIPGLKPEVLNELINLIANNTKEVNELKDENAKLTNENKKCKINKLELMGKIDDLENENRKLQKQVRDLEGDLEFCRKKYDIFKEAFDQLKEDLKNQSGVKGDGQLEALEKLRKILEMQLNSTTITLRECEKRVTPPPCPICPTIPKPTICEQCSRENQELINNLIDQLNNSTSNLNKCQENLQDEKEKSFNCSKEKEECLVNDFKCENELMDCKNKSSTDLSDKYQKCATDLKKCKTDKNNLKQQINQLKFTIANHDRNMAAVLQQRQACERRYVELWKSCTNGTVNPPLDPTCPVVPGNSTIEVVWPEEERCKEFDKNLQEKLDECNQKLLDVHYFINNIGGVIEKYNSNAEKNLPPPDFTNCKNDDEDQVTTISTLEVSDEEEDD